MKVKRQDRIITLRRKSSNFYMSSEQIRRILRMFSKPMERVEVFVIFFCRLVDEECTFLCLEELSQIERQAVMHRLGPLNLFNPFRPDGYYKLDLSQHDTHLLGRILIKMAVGEHGKCLHEEFYNGFGCALPISWIKTLPKKGVYELRFTTPKKDQPAPRAMMIKVAEEAKNEGESDGVEGSDEDEEDGAQGRAFTESVLSGAEPGNTKLRRSVAEDFLGWEFHEDDEDAENDISVQHAALARRRSSAMSVNMDVGQIQDELRRKGIELDEMESKILFRGNLSIPESNVGKRNSFLGAEEDEETIGSPGSSGNRGGRRPSTLVGGRRVSKMGTDLGWTPFGGKGFTGGGEEGEGEGGNGQRYSIGGSPNNTPLKRGRSLVRPLSPKPAGRSPGGRPGGRPLSPKPGGRSPPGRSPGAAGKTMSPKRPTRPKTPQSNKSSPVGGGSESRNRVKAAAFKE